MGPGVRIPWRPGAGRRGVLGFLRHGAGWRIWFLCWILYFLVLWFYFLAWLEVPAAFWRLILLRSGCGYG